MWTEQRLKKYREKAEISRFKPFEHEIRWRGYKMATVQIIHCTAVRNLFAIGWIPAATTCFYGQHSKYADLLELLHMLKWII